MCISSVYARRSCICIVDAQIPYIEIVHIQKLCIYVRCAHIQKLGIYGRYAHVFCISLTFMYMHIIRICMSFMYLHRRCENSIYRNFAYTETVHIRKICAYTETGHIRKICACLPYIPNFSIYEYLPYMHVVHVSAS